MADIIQSLIVILFSQQSKKGLGVKFEAVNVVSLRKEPSIAQWWSVSRVCKVRALWSSASLKSIQPTLSLCICLSASLLPMFWKHAVVLDLWLCLSPSLVNIASTENTFFPLIFLCFFLITEHFSHGGKTEFSFYLSLLCNMPSKLLL